MPMVPEAVIPMLACGRIGDALLVLGGFAPRELAARIDDARPTVICRSCGIEPTRVVDPADHRRRAETHRTPPERIVMLQRAAGTAALGERTPPGTQYARRRTGRPGAGQGDRPLYILYTSGTSDGRRVLSAHRRPRGRAGLLDAGRLPSERVMCGGRPRRRLGCRPQLIVYAPLWCGRRPCCTKASRSAPRTPGRSGVSAATTACRRCSPHDRASRDQAGRSERGRDRQVRPV